MIKGTFDFFFPFNIGFTCDLLNFTDKVIDNFLALSHFCFPSQES